MVVVKSLALCIGIGMAAGWIMPMISIPFVGIIIIFVVGTLIGRWLSNTLDHRLGHNTVKTIVFGVLIGMSLSPYGGLPVTLWYLLQAALTGQGITIVQALTAMLSMLFDPVAFFAGLLRPFLMPSRW